MVLADLLDQGVLEGQGEVSLVEVSHAHAGADLQGACVWGFFADDEPEQGGLAAAVGADEPDFLAGEDFEVDVWEEGVARVLLGEVCGLSDVFTGFEDGFELEAEEVGFEDGVVDVLEFFESFHFAGDLPVVFVAAGEGFQYFFLSVDFVAVFLEGLLFAVLEELLGFFVFGVGLVVGFDVACFDFEDSVDEVVEEVAVVGDEDDGVGEVRDFAFEPFDGVDVEVVRGFVEEEEVAGVWFGEDAGECDLLAFAAGEGVDALAWGEVGEAGFFEEALGRVPADGACGFGGGDAEFLEFFDEGGVVWGVVDGGVLELGFEGGDLSLDGVGLGGAGDEVGDGGVVGADGDLVEVAEGEVVGLPEVAAALVVVAEEDVEERGFAAAVLSEEADAVLGVDFEGGVVEEVFAFEAFGEVAGFDEDVHGC